MKKYYAALIAILATYHASSQIKAGQALLGGSISYDYQTSKQDGIKYKFAEFTFSPSAGIFIINKLATGLRVSINRHCQRNLNGILFYYKQYHTTFSPFARYYLLKASSRYNVFTDTSFDSYVVKEKVNGVKRKEYGNGFTLSAGPVIFITPQIATELAFGYSNRNLDSDRHLSFISSLGFQFHFGKK